MPRDADPAAPRYRSRAAGSGTDAGPGRVIELDTDVICRLAGSGSYQR